jgi:Fe-S oxidoreductase
MSVCPVKIDSADVTLNLRSYLEQEGASGHPIKSKMLHYFGQEPEMIPLAAKAAAVGQTIQSRAVHFIPSFWRRRLKNPLFLDPGPYTSSDNIFDILGLHEHFIFLPEQTTETPFRHGVLYFPGCGSGLFYPEISLAGIYLLLLTGFPVVVPNEHKCCGYPLLSAGCLETFDHLMKKNIQYFQKIFQKASENSILIDFMLTSCGTGRAALENYNISGSLSNSLQLMDVLQFILPYLKKEDLLPHTAKELMYHAACHGAWTNVPTDRADLIYAEKLGEFLDTQMKITPYCCAESGLGALTAPKVYNELRKRKRLQLNEDLKDYEQDFPVLVSCPSCKIGLNRIMSKQKTPHPVRHSLEYLIEHIKGADWKNRLLHALSPQTEQNSCLVMFSDQ